MSVNRPTLAPPIDRSVERYLLSALRVGGNKNTLEEVYSKLSSRHAQLWTDDNCAVVTQILLYPDYRALDIWLAGGDLEEIIGLLPGAERFAQEHGCTKVEVTGRKGWQRALQTEGFKPTMVTLEKDL